jgi:hypothetical protein
LYNLKGKVRPEKKMTEQEWLDADSVAVREYFWENLSPRTVCLFACACVRRIWHLLPDARSRKAVEVAERLADGQAILDEQDAALEAAYAVVEAAPYLSSDREAALAAYNTLDFNGDAMLTDPAEGHEEQDYKNVVSALDNAAGAVVPMIAEKEQQQALRHGEMTAHYKLLMDLGVSPNRRHPGALSWLSWNDGAIYKLAKAIYEERAFDRMPILGNALEDAGCDNADILNHCRAPGPHVRGCWVVDLLLGKS